jgi:hypothetical protein
MDERTFKQEARRQLGNMLGEAFADNPEMHRFMNRRTGASLLTDSPDKYRDQPEEWLEVPKRAN